MNPLVELHDKAGAASGLLKALGHPNRLLLLCLLVEQERSVGELGAMIGLRQANVSQQLAKLRAEGLVDARREGKSAYYFIADPAARQVLTVLYDIYCGPEAVPSGVSSARSYKTPPQ